MEKLKIGDRIRWKVTSPAILTMVAGQRAEVVNVLTDRDGLVTIFKNLDHPGPREHTFGCDGEIPDEYYERII